MSPDAEYAYMASRQALEQAKIDTAYLDANEVGIIFGNDGIYSGIAEMNTIMNDYHDSLMVGPSALFRSLPSSVTMSLSTIFHLKGINCCIGAACASSNHAIGIATTFIRSGLQSMIVVGGTVETDMRGAVTTDAIEAHSLHNDAPQQASRPFDKDRDGMVPSGGAATLVLEEYEHAFARGATILAEVLGYGFSSNGIDDISQPSADGELRAMQRALDDAHVRPDDIDYVNAHATSTVLGDIAEAKALTQLFGGKKAWIGATKSMTGHENWMAGASETVYSILMMQHGFVAPTINLENVIDEAKNLKIATECIDTDIHLVLSNSSGMGGTNSALVFRKI